MKQTLLLLLILALRVGALHAAEGPNTAEQKLREALRSTMLQLRAAETERATLQAAQAESAVKEKALMEKVEALTKQFATEVDAAQKTAAAQKEQLAMRGEEIASLKTELEKWQADHQRISAVAAAKEAERAKFAGQAVVLQRRVDEQQTKNQEMHKIGTEVLRRYQRFVLGDALAAREPFTGIAKVKFENLAQEFQDQLDDARVAPVAPPTPDAPKASAKVKAGAAVPAPRAAKVTTAQQKPAR